jgi:hypothetical protein
VILRITPGMLLQNAGKKYHMRDISKMEGPRAEEFSVGGKNGWKVSWNTGIMNAWAKNVKTPLTVVVIRPSFRKPMVLCTNLKVENLQDAIDVYENTSTGGRLKCCFGTSKSSDSNRFASGASGRS